MLTSPKPSAMTTLVQCIAATLLVTTAGAQSPAAIQQDSKEGKGPSPATGALHAAALRELPFSDRDDFADAQRGFVATLPTMTVRDAQGRTSWDLSAYDFIKPQEAPATVHPSLWRMAQLNMNNGLFKVVDRVYQVRGFDLSNLTIIEGDTGLILIDPLINAEVAQAALALYLQHRPAKPVRAVIYTHSHADHYGGVKGVVLGEDVDAGRVQVIAPDGFMEEAVSENVFAGHAMTRRTLYQYGAMLPRGPRGQVDAGLGKTTSSGTFTLIAPNDLVNKTGETRTVDGVQMTFHMAPGTEAPAEMLIYFPQFKVLNAAEVATHTLHNLYTLRGAQVRNAVNWWKTLHSAVQAYGSSLEVVIAQHHWPMWGRERAVNFLQDQRDMYKYLHDQSLRLLNAGSTMTEIAEQLTLPPRLAQKWYNRGYYGSVNHNTKAVYQRYLGWYDSNPAHLWAHPPEAAAARYVEFMGGAAAVLDKANKSFLAGDYRWTAEVVNHVVFADPNNYAARALQADALEQLGYQTENPTWRNEFLMGAHELRAGVPKHPMPDTSSPDMLAAMPAPLILDYAGIRLNGPRAAEQSLHLLWEQPEGTVYALELRNGVLLYSEGKPSWTPDATLVASKVHLAALVAGALTLEQGTASSHIKIRGDAAPVRALLALLDAGDSAQEMFNIVTP